MLCKIKLGGNKNDYIYLVQKLFFYFLTSQIYFNLQIYLTKHSSFILRKAAIKIVNQGEFMQMVN